MILMIMISPTFFFASGTNLTSNPKGHVSDWAKENDFTTIKLIHQDLISTPLTMSSSALKSIPFVAALAGAFTGYTFFKPMIM